MDVQTEEARMRADSEEMIARRLKALEANEKARDELLELGVEVYDDDPASGRVVAGGLGRNFYGRDAVHVLEQVRGRIAEDEHRAAPSSPILPPEGDQPVTPEDGRSGGQPNPSVVVNSN